MYYDEHRQEFKVGNAEYWASHGDEITSRRVGNRLYEKKRKEAIFEKSQYQDSTGGGQPILTSHKHFFAHFFYRDLLRNWKKVEKICFFQT